MEKPFANYGVWDVKSGATWNLDTRMKLEGEDWKDTLTYCPRDQKWMIEAASKLEQAWDLHTDGLLPREAKEHVLNRFVDIRSYRSEEREALQATWDSWMKHAVPSNLHDEDITYALYDRLFPSMPKAYRVGVCYSVQMVGMVPMEEHDYRMDCVLAGSQNAALPHGER